MCYSISQEEERDEDSQATVEGDVAVRSGRTSPGRL
jgi:hypothetical protein